MLVAIQRRLLWRRRVQAAQAWRDAERADAAERDAAFRRILEQGRRISPLTAQGGSS
jgi:hypothetical protein